MKNSYLKESCDSIHYVGLRSGLIHGLLLLAALGGMRLAWNEPIDSWWLTPWAAATGTQPLCQPSESYRSQAEGDGRVQFIQEPIGRSSFRPDFSSGLRRAHQRNNFTMLRAFSEAVVDARLSTVQLIDEAGGQIALGAIVDADGWIATKASQLPSSSTVKVHLSDNSELDAEVVKRSTDVDLALLRVQRKGLPVVKWANTVVPSRGTWLATTDIDKMPTAVGVVSAGIQNIRKSKAVLGVELVDSAAGPAVTRVLIGTGAERAGLRVGDNIVGINGNRVTTHSGFLSTISTARGGQIINLLVRRGEMELEFEARLMDLAEELLDETEMEVNGPVSARATGFARVFLHDTVLDPNQCGGPLCNLDGQVVGLNIARAGRVSSYALPADMLQPLIQGMIAEATLVSRPVTAPVAGNVR